MRSGKHVMVHALFRSRVVGSTAFEELAAVTPLRAVPNDADTEELDRGWHGLGLTLMEKAGSAALCMVAELSNAKGYCTPVINGGAVVAALAPWIGLRSRSERPSTERAEDDEEGQLSL